MLPCRTVADPETEAAAASTSRKSRKRAKQRPLEDTASTHPVQLRRQQLQTPLSESEPVSEQEVHDVAAMVRNSEDVTSARRDYPARHLVADDASTAPSRYDVRAILADPAPTAFVTHILTKCVGKPPARKKAAYLASVVAENTHRETSEDNSAGTAPICIDAAVRVTR